MLVQVTKCLFSLVVIFLLIPAANSQTFSNLVLNKPIDRAISGFLRDSFELDLPLNQFANIEVEQLGVDVTVKLFDPDGNEIATIDKDLTKTGKEELAIVAKNAGLYRIEISKSTPNLNEAGSFRITLRETHRADEEEQLLSDALTGFYESSRFLSLGKLVQAIAPAQRALDIREKILASNHPDVVSSLILLGRIYGTKGELDQAEKFIAQTLEKARPDSLDHAAGLDLLASLRVRQGKLDEARQNNEKALSIRIAIIGKESLLTSDSLQKLALIYRAQNDRPKADQLFRETLAIREKLFGENYLGVAQVLNDYGLFHYGGGDYKTALQTLERSLAIYEKVLSPENRQIGISLNNLGLVEWRKGDNLKARGYYLRALDIFENADGPVSDGVASISHNLGILFKEDDEFKKAEEFYSKALGIWEKMYGENYPGTSNAISSLGILYQSMGEYERAEKFFIRAHAINEKLGGAFNEATNLTFRSLARVYAAKGEIDQAVHYQTQISHVEEKIMPLNLSIGSERQKIAYYKRLQTIDRVITLSAITAPTNEKASELALSAVFRRKGRILDALSENVAALRNRFSEKDRSLLDRLNDVNTKLSGLLRSGQQKYSTDEYLGKIKSFENERETIEIEISRVSSGFYQPTQPVTVAAVQAAVPKNAVLIEFAVYRPYNWKTESDEIGYDEPHYIAYILRNSGKMAWKDLGPSKPIDDAIKEFQIRLRDPKSNDVQKFSRAVDEKLMQPIRQYFGNANHLLISPDGQLNLIPFDALVDQQNHYLIENYSIAYLTSGRDLLRKRDAVQSTTEPLVFSNPLFGKYDSSETPASSSPTLREENPGRGATSDGIASPYFSPIAGTIEEAKAIQTLFPGAKSFAGEFATESELKKIVAPQILHIATHGFFLRDNDDLDAEEGNPLLRSGLAFAGANQRKGGDDDGILTALEASGLNLWGTKLVVLSACDTGLGEVKNGEGVFGMRRAFTLAGTETLMMSLWAVSDYATRELMISYYKNLKKGIGRGEALRHVQLEMLKKPNRRHPFYWASFIQSGEWANLDGKR